MAVAACHPTEKVVSYLKTLFELELAPMVHLAAGHAIVQASGGADAEILAALDSSAPRRAEGAIRSLAVTRVVPSEATIRRIIAFVSEARHEQLRFWAAAAAAGWPPATTRRFLRECLVDPRTDTRQAAEASLQGKYLKLNPL